MIHMNPEFVYGEGAGTTTTSFEMKLERPRNSSFHTDIFPKVGQWYHLSSPGKAGRHILTVAEIWVCQILALGYPVHWIDGACRIDPSRLFKLLRQMNEPVEECLSRLYVSRGFTLHQLVRQIARLSDEIKLTGTPFVVVDGLLTMHMDEQVGDRETRMLLQHQCNILASLHQIQPLMLVTTGDSKLQTKRELQLNTMLMKNVQAELYGEIQGEGRQQRLYLHHKPSFQTGYWIQDVPELTLKHFDSRRDKIIQI